MRYFLDTEFIEDGKTIDLISIGIVAEDGREYYAINKEFSLRKAWKNVWVRENVLRPIFDEFYSHALSLRPSLSFPIPSFGFWEMRKVVKSVGRSRKEIKLQVAKFIYGLNLGIENYWDVLRSWTIFCDDMRQTGHPIPPPEFWAYYADYDWVVFCQLFGTMMDLPDGFPMYCLDIKQECNRLGNPGLPKRGEGEHNALEDARWNKKAFEFLAAIS